MTKILIVDDNPSVRAALRMCFKTKTHWIVCGEAENGQAAIELVRSLKPDVALLDALFHDEFDDGVRGYRIESAGRRVVEQHLGLVMMARAMATRRRMPPESSDGRMS